MTYRQNLAVGDPGTRGTDAATPGTVVPCPLRSGAEIAVGRCVEAQLAPAGCWCAGNALVALQFIRAHDAQPARHGPRHGHGKRGAVYGDAGAGGGENESERIARKARLAQLDVLINRATKRQQAHDNGDANGSASNA